jgi:hypothetical protein
MRRLALVLALLVPTAARADDATDLFDEGVRLLREHRYAEACDRFDRSFKLHAGIGTRAKMGECYEGMGRLASAWLAWQDTAAMARKQGDPREKVAADRARALEPGVPRLTLTFSAGVTVTRDDEPAENGVAAPVDPGRHAIKATAPGKRTWQTDVRLDRGEQRSLDVPMLEPLPVAATPSPRPPAPPPPAVAVEAEPRPQSHRGQRIAGIAMMGAGGVAVAVGIGFGIAAKKNWDDAFSGSMPHCASDNTCDGPGQDLTDSARSDARLANIFVAAGAAVAIGGAVVWWLGREKAPVQVSVGPGSFLVFGHF